MLIEGRKIAENIFSDLKVEVSKLKAGGINPTLAVVMIGDDPSSLSYIRQKEKAALSIGATLKLIHKPSFTVPELISLITQLNKNPAVHGIIVQRPLPDNLNQNIISNLIRADKDVDGFNPNSKYEPPIDLAVMKILEVCYQNIIHDSRIPSTSFNEEFLRTRNNKKFKSWLRLQKIVIIGRGETAGKPINKYLQNIDCTTSIIHSQSVNPGPLIKSADIVISAVGKKNIIGRNDLKPGVILISVGLSKDNYGKLQGDYNEDEIKDIALFYTPTPGGVGPVNVAYLMNNLLEASKREKSIY